MVGEEVGGDMAGVVGHQVGQWDWVQPGLMWRHKEH